MDGRDTLQVEGRGTEDRPPPVPGDMLQGERTSTGCFG